MGNKAMPPISSSLIRRGALPAIQDASDAQQPAARELRCVSKTDNAQLPRWREGSIYAGQGTGLVCAGCDDRITRDEIEYEIAPIDTFALRFHMTCYNVWKCGHPAAASDVEVPTASHLLRSVR